MEGVVKASMPRDGMMASAIVRFTAPYRAKKMPERGPVTDYLVPVHDFSHLGVNVNVY